MDEGGGTFSINNSSYEGIETNNMRVIEQYASFLTTSDEKYRKIQDKLFNVEIKRYGKEFIERILMDNDNLRKSREKLLEICRPLAQQNLEYAKQLQALKKQCENANSMCIAWQHAKDQMYLLYKSVDKELAEKTQKLEIAEKSLSQLRRIKAKRKKKQNSSGVKVDSANDSQPSSVHSLDHTVQQKSDLLEGDERSDSPASDGKMVAAFPEESSDEELNLCDVISAWNINKTEDNSNLVSTSCNDMPNIVKRTASSTASTAKIKGVKSSVKKTKKARRKTASPVMEHPPPFSYDQKSNSSNCSSGGTPGQNGLEDNGTLDSVDDFNNFSPELSLERIEVAPSGVLSPNLSNLSDTNFEKMKVTTPFIPAITSSTEIKPENKLPTKLPHSSPSERKKQTEAKKSPVVTVPRSLRPRKAHVSAENSTPSKILRDKPTNKSLSGDIISRKSETKTFSNYETIFDDLDISDSDSSTVQISVPSSQKSNNLPSKSVAESNSAANENMSKTTKTSECLNSTNTKKILNSGSNSDISLLGSDDDHYSFDEDDSMSEKNASEFSDLRSSDQNLTDAPASGLKQIDVCSPTKSQNETISTPIDPAENLVKLSHQFALPRIKNLSESSSDMDHSPEVLNTCIKSKRISLRNRKAVVGKITKERFRKETTFVKQLKKSTVASKVPVNHPEILDIRSEPVHTKSIFDPDEAPAVPTETISPASSESPLASETIPSTSKREQNQTAGDDEIALDEEEFLEFSEKSSLIECKKQSPKTKSVVPTKPATSPEKNVISKKSNTEKNKTKQRESVKKLTEEVAEEFSVSTFEMVKAELKQEIVKDVRSQRKTDVKIVVDKEPAENVETAKLAESISNETVDDTKSCFDPFLGDNNFEQQGMNAPTPPEDSSAEFSDIGSPEIVTPPLSPISSIGNSPQFLTPTLSNKQLHRTRSLKSLAIQEFKLTKSSSCNDLSEKTNKISKCEKLFSSLNDSDHHRVHDKILSGSVDSLEDVDFMQDQEVEKLMNGFDSDGEELVLNLIHKEFTDHRLLSPLSLNGLKCATSPEQKSTPQKSEFILPPEKSKCPTENLNLSEELTTKLSPPGIPKKVPRKLSMHKKCNSVSSGNQKEEGNIAVSSVIEDPKPDQGFEQISISSEPVPQNIAMTKASNSSEPTDFVSDERTAKESTALSLKQRLASTVGKMQPVAVKDWPRRVQKRLSPSLKPVIPEKRSKHAELSEKNPDASLPKQEHLPKSMKTVMALQYQRRNLRNSAVTGTTTSKSTSYFTPVPLKKQNTISIPLTNPCYKSENSDIEERVEPKTSQIAPINNSIQSVQSRFSQGINEKPPDSYSSKPYVSSVQNSKEDSEDSCSTEESVVGVQASEFNFKSTNSFNNYSEELGSWNKNPVTSISDVIGSQNEKLDSKYPTSQLNNDDTLDKPAELSDKKICNSLSSVPESAEVQSNCTSEPSTEPYKCERNCLWTGYKYYKEEHCRNLIEKAQETPHVTMNYRGRNVNQEMVMIALDKVTKPRLSWTKDAEVCIQKLQDIEEMVVVQSIIKFIQEDESDLNEVLHPQLTITQQLLLVICHRLASSHHPNLITSLLKAIEKTLFLGDDASTIDNRAKKKSKKQIKEELEFQVQSTRNLSMFFTIICKSLGQLQRCRAFVYDALYMSVHRAHLIINSALSIWPQAFLPASKSKDCPLTMVLVFEIFNHSSDKKVDFYKVDELKDLMGQYYGYSNPLKAQKTREDIMTTLSSVLDRQGCVEAFVLLAKRGQWKWASSKLIFGFLFPILEDFKNSKIKEERAKIVVKIIGLVTRAFPTGEAWLETKKVLEYLEQLLLDDKLGTMSFKESVASSIAQLYRSDPDVCFSILSKWNPPNGELSVEFLEKFKTLFYGKKLTQWYQEISTICSS